MKHSLVILLGLCLLMNTSLLAQNWQFSNGPNRPHIVNDISLGKSGSTQRIFAADADVLKLSIDGGSTWSTTPTSPPTEMLQPLVVACNNTNPNIAVMAKSYQASPPTNAVFRTADGGSSWSPVTPSASYNFTPLRIVISAGNSDLAFLGTKRVPSDAQTPLWRSATGGQTWLPNNDFNAKGHTHVNDILPYPQSAYSSYIWVGGSTNEASASPNMSVETPPATPTKGIWRSVDNGVEWSYQGDGLPSGTDRNITSLAIAITQTSTALYAATKTSNYAMIYRSVDLGVSWASISDLAGLTITEVRALKSFVNTDQSITLVAATDRGFARSTNGGTAWTLQNSSILGSDIDGRQVAFDLNDATGNTLYFATFTSVYKSMNLGASWTASVTGSNPQDVAGMAFQSGTAHSVSSSYSAITRYAGSAWQSPIKVGGGAFSGKGVAVNRTNTSYANASGDNAGKAAIYSRADGGNGWTEAQSWTRDNSSLKVVVADPKSGSPRVYAGGVAGTNGSPKNFYASTDYGVTWNGGVTVGTNGAIAVNALAIDDFSGSSGYSIKLYAGLDNGGGVFKSADAGVTWPSSVLSSNSILALALNSKTAALADVAYTGSANAMWKTTNGFTTASSLTIPFTGAKRILMHPSYPDDANHVWVITGDGQNIYKTVDGGSNWVSVSTTAVPKPMNDLKSDPQDNAMIYVGSSAGIYKVNPAPEVATGVVSAPSGGHPGISWTASTQEVDLPTAKYKVYRYFRYCVSYFPHKQCGSPEGTECLTQNGISGTSYVDTQWDITTCGGCAGGPPRIAGYYVKVVDNAGIESDASISIEFTVNNDGPFERVGVDPVPTAYALEANYPNPFNPLTIIRYALPEDAGVRLTVVDMIGREVSVLVNEKQTAGYKSVEFDASKLASGMYLYKLVAGTFTDVKKMVVAK